MTKQNRTYCRECSQEIELTESSIQADAICDSCSHRLDLNANRTVGNDDNGTNGGNDASSSVDDSSADPESLAAAKLAEALEKLPPKFLADDPEFIDRRINAKRDNRVLLPDGGGGLQSVDNNIVRIEHKGKTYELTMLSPEQRRKRQRLVNAVSIALAAIFLVVFFLWLVR